MRAQTTYIMANKKEKLTIERSVPRHYYLAWIASQARNDDDEKNQLICPVLMTIYKEPK